MIYIVMQDNLIVWITLSDAEAIAKADALATMGHPCTVIQTHAWVPYVKTV